MTTTANIKKNLADHYKPTRLGVRVYNFLRLTIFPVAWFSTLLEGKKGTVLCLGCGYGVLETALALEHPKLKIIASDIIASRIEAAENMVHGVPNIEFEVIDVTKLVPTKQFDNILFIDLLHHLADGEQEKLLDTLWQHLKPGGYLIMKDVDTSPRWKYYWNKTHDTLMAGLPLTYKSSGHYQDYMTKKGGKVTAHRPIRFHSPYNHYALTIQKP